MRPQNRPNQNGCCCLPHFLKKLVICPLRRPSGHRPWTSQSIGWLRGTTTDHRTWGARLIMVDRYHGRAGPITDVAPVPGVSEAESTRLARIIHHFQWIWPEPVVVTFDQSLNRRLFSSLFYFLCSHGALDGLYMLCISHFLATVWNLE